MIQHSVNVSTVSRVPNTNGVIPTSGDEQVRQLSVPQQTTHWGLVTLQNHHTTSVAVVPHTTRSSKTFKHKCSTVVEHIQLGIFLSIWSNAPVVWSTCQAAVAKRRPANVKDLCLMTFELLQRRVRCGEVEDANDLVLTSGRNQISEKRTPQRGEGDCIDLTSCFLTHLLFGFQSQPNTEALCCSFKEASPVTVRTKLQSQEKNSFT